MPLVFPYLIKLSCCLAMVYLFYRLLLHRLTFYTANRWYLLGYSLLCFFIPLLNISGLIARHQLSKTKLVQAIPVLETYTHPPVNLLQSNVPTSYTIWQGCLWVFAGGIIFLFVRLVVQYYSYRRLKKSARLLAGAGVRLYQVAKPIVPFSFGNSIFIHQQQHSEPELQEIIRHEFVHVKQRHTVDIICAEVLCILNWYNPFAWALRHAVRQNLEFIADSQVLRTGIDKKEYQYLLLKVMGVPQFAIAAPFNFSSLKKRIVMMNRLKSANVHLVKFLFMLPLLAVLLLAFRSGQLRTQNSRHVATDTMPTPPAPPAIIAPAPEVVPDKAAPLPPVVGIGLAGDTTLLPEDYRAFLKRNPAVKTIHWTEHNIVIELKSGQKEIYRQDDTNAIAKAIKKYGTLPVAPPPPPPPPAVSEPGEPEKPKTAQPPADAADNVSQAKIEALQLIIAQLKDSVRGIAHKEVTQAMQAHLTSKKALLQKEQIALQEHLQANQAAAVTKQKVLLKMQQQQKTSAQEQKEAQEYLQKMKKQLQQKLKAEQEAKDRSTYTPASPKSNQTIIITTDSIAWNAPQRSLSFSGKTMIDKKEAAITGNAAVSLDKPSLILLNGKEVTLDKSFINYKGGKYKVVTLDKKTSLKKYGAKGKNGALEIETL